MARLDLGAGQPLAREVAEAGDGGAADGAPAHLDQAAAGGGHHLLEMLAALAERRDELVEASGRIGLQPGGEIQKDGAVGGHAGGQRQAASDQRTVARGAPGYEPLVFLVDQRLGAIGDRLQVAHFQAQARILRLGAVARADELHGGEHREGDGADERRHEHDLAEADIVVEQPWGDLRVSGGRCGGGEEDEMSGPANRQRVPAMPSHAKDPSAVALYSWVALIRDRRQPARALANHHHV